MPRIVWAGIGCRRGVPAERLEAALCSGLEAAGLHPAALAGVCTIDRKGEEPGLLELCRRRRLPLLTYSPEELSRECIIPSTFDMGVADVVAEAVKAHVEH